VSRRAVGLALGLALAACGDNARCDPDDVRCTRLSYYGFFDDVAHQVPAAGVIPYDVNTPLFSDYTTKDRYLYLPPGTVASWSDGDAFDLPVGAVLIKTFSYLHDRRDPSLGRRLLETRLLVHGAAGWHGTSYLYDADGGDATLAIAGGMIDTSWIHDDGNQRTNAYVVPNQNQCKNCHAEHDNVVTPLGPKARHLNRAGPDGSGIADQLENLIDLGELAGAPPRATWPRLPDAMNPATGTLDARARAWLDINCGHCHNPRGAARTSGLYLDIAETDPAVVGVCKPPVATGRGSGGHQYDIVPGQPDASIMTYRIASTEPEIKMPEVGRNLVHEEGLALIRDWITAMPGSCATAR
jgi:uncharacterized repeat protein (TIGR03806 family)